MVPPFRAFVGIAIILVSFVYMGYREIALGKRLGPVNAILRDAVRNDVISVCNMYVLPTDEKVLRKYNRDVVVLHSNAVTVGTS